MTASHSDPPPFSKVRSFWGRSAAFVARHAKMTILLWATLAAFLSSAAPTFSDVAVQDQSAFLGRNAPSLAAAERIKELWPREEFNEAAIVVLSRRTRLDERDRQYARRLERWLNGPRAPRNVSVTVSPFSRPQFRDILTARNGRALLVIVGFTTSPFEPATNEAVARIREHVGSTDRRALAVHVTGAGGIGADQATALERAVHRTTIITLVLVIVILLWVFRSPVAPLVPLATIGLAYVVAGSLVALLAAAGLEVSSIVETFMVVFVFGAGTDYCLFILSRFREELAHRREARPTLVATMAVVGAVIASSAAAVIAAFATQGIADFGLFRTTGPALAIATVVTLLAGQTLTPAFLSILGRRTFWPHRFDARNDSATDSGPLAPPSDEKLPNAVPVGSREGAP
ncbi:MAG: MMPL family transporter [Actinomycetota bacterium]|nr:MMPL family transporter [Actinomycetota bacterium]